MGNQNNQLRENEGYEIVSQLPIGNIVKSTKNDSLHFLKQYSFTSQEAYQNALNTYSLKLSNKNQHILNFQHFTTKSENSFCSTFYKIMLIFQYIDYTLDRQIEVRIKENRPFTEKQMWSVLCSCVLAAVHLINTQGKIHCALTPKDIRLTSSGCVKLLSQQMIGINPLHSVNLEGHPKNLAITLLHCFLLEEITNQDSEYLQNLTQSLDCSRDMKEMLLMMIKRNDIRFVELEEQLFKLVQDDESLASHSNTPLLKQHSPANSTYKCPKISWNQNNDRKHNIGNSYRPLNYQSSKQITLQRNPCDSEDEPSTRFQFQHELLELENPDETDGDETERENQFEGFMQKNYEQSKQFQKRVQNQYNSNHNYGVSIKLNNSDTNLRESLRQISNNFNYQIPEYKLLEKEENRMKDKKKQNFISAKSTHSEENPYLSADVEQRKRQESLFTDPKLFSMIKNDLKEIQMRKSASSLDHNLSQQQSKTVTSFKEDNQNTNKNFQFSSSLSRDNLLPIEIIKQSSQEYREEQQCESATKVFKNNLHLQNQISQNKKTCEITQKHQSSRQITEKQEYEDEISNRRASSRADNIMFDEDQGFKRKKTTEREKNQENASNQEIQKSNPHNTFNPHQFSKSQHEEPSSSQKLVHVTEVYNKGKYTGTKLNGKRHGHGTFYYIEGGKYVGNWNENKMTGYGVLYYPNSEIAYEGNWDSDQLSGWGVLYNEEVVNLRNPFDYRDWSLVDDYWIKYQGEFWKDNKSGKGKLYLSNGEVFEGYFESDMVDGQGILYRDGGCTVKGKWDKNKLVKLF